MVGNFAKEGNFATKKNSLPRMASLLKKAIYAKGKGGVATEERDLAKATLPRLVTSPRMASVPRTATSCKRASLPIKKMFISRVNQLPRWLARTPIQFYGWEGSLTMCHPLTKIWCQVT
jgi:hypothetical protein